MKKLTALSLAVLLIVSALSLCASAEESKKTVTIPRVTDGVIRIDAQLDDAYGDCEAQAMTEQNLDYFENNPSDSTGVFYAVYDSSYVYIYVDVTDANIDYSHEDPEQTWNRESIGVMFDFSYIRTPEYEYSYADNGDLICYANLSGDDVLVTYHMYADDGPYFEKIQHSTISEKGGHIYYEIAMPIPSEVTIEEGGKFGLEVIACNAADGSRAGVVSWSPEGSEMWHYTDVCGTAVWGTYSFEEEAAAAPAAEAPASDAAPAADAVPAAAAPAPAAEAAPAPAAAPVAAAAPAAQSAAPQTSDMAGLAVITALSALAAAMVVSKKH